VVDGEPGAVETIRAELDVGELGLVVVGAQSMRRMLSLVTKRM